ncbi:hypothetical protein CLOSTMETH_02951 [[Clostridium] methylpentosum DSM 5476]|uniref:Uncharacterized protein n=1 Tax=[Clostridium] methylpentosum DSM 5476 TaxID=537013 RepID=C0EGF8_9FIRM|nr:hypothetical protein CLOSTMETH_02951 [[Clostridium] methylpentosum DSM 5476]
MKTEITAPKDFLPSATGSLVVESKPRQLGAETPKQERRSNCCCFLAAVEAQQITVSREI